MFKSFNKMTAREITAELERFNRQLMNQQAQKIPLTQAQLRRWRALSSAYKRIWTEIAN